MNKNTTYILVAVLAIILVVAGAGVLLLMNDGADNGNGNGNGTPNVIDATSLQFEVEDPTGTYKYSAKNIGSETLLRIEYLDEEFGFAVIIDGAEHEAWSNMAGEWVEEDFEATWDDWYDLWRGYVDSLAHWTEGEYTSADGTIRIYNIEVNPTLADSLFQVPS
jgi:hypothetical protein